VTLCVLCWLSGKQVQKSFVPFISEITVAEIERTPDPSIQSKIKEVISQFSVLPLTDDVEWLANEYVRYGAVPESYPEDAYHIAIAVVNEIDFLLSWNFKHIVRRKTRDMQEKSLPEKRNLKD
jgi:hypothetical protein